MSLTVIERAEEKTDFWRANYGQSVFYSSYRLPIWPVRSDLVGSDWIGGLAIAGATLALAYRCLGTRYSSRINLLVVGIDGIE